MIGIISLALIGLAALILELFVPAGGLIGLVGLGSIVYSVVQAFREIGSTFGSLFLLGVFILVPLVFIFYFKYFPRSFMGKKLILFQSFGFDSTSKSSEADTSQDLIGKTGFSETPLHPAGTILIEDRRYNAVSEGEYIEKDEEVRIVRVEGNRIVVRKGGV